jgi:hypothetical protein
MADIHRAGGNPLVAVVHSHLVEAVVRSHLAAGVRSQAAGVRSQAAGAVEHNHPAVSAEVDSHPVAVEGNDPEAAAVAGNRPAAVADSSPAEGVVDRSLTLLTAEVAVAAG